MKIALNTAQEAGDYCDISKRCNHGYATASKTCRRMDLHLIVILIFPLLSLFNCHIFYGVSSAIGSTCAALTCTNLGAKLIDLPSCQKRYNDMNISLGLSFSGVGRSNRNAFIFLWCLDRSSNAYRIMSCDPLSFLV